MAFKNRISSPAHVDANDPSNSDPTVDEKFEHKTREVETAREINFENLLWGKRDWLNWRKFVIEYTPPPRTLNRQPSDVFKRNPILRETKLKRESLLRLKSIQHSNCCDVHTQTHELHEEYCDMETQTEFIDNRPYIRPPYIRGKAGVDASTSIPSGDLFNLEMEAQPIIDVLVDSCLEQSKIEEDQMVTLSEMRKLQREYREKRREDRDLLRRLEANERSVLDDKQRRLHQSCIAKKLDEDLRIDFISRGILVSQIHENAQVMADNFGKQQIEADLCPWLGQEAAKEVNESGKALNEFIRELISERQDAYRMDLDKPEPLASGDDEGNVEAEAEEEGEDESGRLCVGRNL